MKKIEELNGAEILEVINKLNSIAPENRSEFAEMIDMDKRLERRAVELGKLGDPDAGEVLEIALCHLVGIESFDDITEELGAVKLYEVLDALMKINAESEMEENIKQDFTNEVQDVLIQLKTKEYEEKRKNQIYKKLGTPEQWKDLTIEKLENLLNYPLVYPLDNITCKVVEEIVENISKLIQQKTAKAELSELVGVE